MKNKLLFTIISLIILVLTAGCAVEEPAAPSGGYVTGATLNETTPGSNDIFLAKVEDGSSSIGLDVRGTLASGSIIVLVKDETGLPVFMKNLDTTVIQMTEKIPLQPGSYSISIAWEGPVQATYNLEWAPGEIEVPQVTAMGLIPGAGMLIAGLFFAIYGIRKGGWKYSLLGAAFWAGTVIIKFLIAIALNPTVYKAITGAIPGLTGIILVSIYIGLLTGITEILITWLFLRKTKLGQAVWEKMLSFSLGFGSVEAILLGVSSMVGIITAMTMGSLVPLSTLRQLAVTNNIWYDLAPIVERIFTIGVHLGCTLLLFYAVRKNQGRWFWASFALKSGLDAVAGYAQLSGNLTSVSFLWTIEVMVILFGLAGYGISYWLKNRMPQVQTLNLTSESVQEEAVAPVE
jgi:uncharacterized membrane protein YhfC